MCNDGATGRRVTTPKMTAVDVRECLALRWPADQYLMIDEAPDSADRGGRKLDALVVSLWLSRGHQLDGVEIKVSASDWKRELANPEKADWWWRHVHRFWLAVPANLVETVQPDLPPSWGLLSCEIDKPPRVVVKAPTHDPEPLPWNAVVGLLRAASGAGVNALMRAEARGVQKGRELERADAERRHPDAQLREELERLRGQIRDFEQASGLTIGRYDDGGDLGRLVAIVRAELSMPRWTVGAMGRVARSMREIAEGLARQAKDLEASAERVSAALEEATTAAAGR